MIILEGCDATGKSTLAKWLSEELGYQYFKDGFHKLGIKYYTGHALKKSSHTISDRFHLGEFVYPTVKKDGRPPLTVWQQLMVERILLTKPSVLILCETDIETIWHNFDTRGEDFIDKQQAVDVVRLFQDRYDVSILPKIKFNYKVDSKDELIIFIRDVIEREKRNVLFSSIVESIGTVNNPDVMLVGEGYNGNKLGKVNRAFAHPSSSGAYLHQALAFNQDRSYYITNAGKTENSEKNVELLMEEISFTSPKKIIALGKVADKILTKMNVEHFSTVHPSYQSRFAHNKLFEYSQTLR